MANVRVLSNTAAIAEALYKKFQKMQGNNLRPLTVAISGGTTPKSIFSYWTSHYPTATIWQQVIFFWVDERCVLPTDEESNYGEAQRIFFDHVNVPYSHVHRVHCEESTQDALRLYEEALKRHVPLVNGLPQFDLIWLGMGTDGHTASIFPGNEQLLKSEKWCDIVAHPQSGQNRITLTGSVISNAKNIMVIATGSDKANIVEEVIVRTGNWKSYPISHIAPRAGRMRWILDQKAASQIDTKRLVSKDND